MRKPSLKIRQTTLTTLAVGAALSVGGINEATHDVHFLLRKDLDAVRIVSLPESLQSTWPQIEADVLAGNNASAPRPMSYNPSAYEFAIEPAPPPDKNV